MDVFKSKEDADQLLDISFDLYNEVLNLAMSDVNPGYTSSNALMIKSFLNKVDQSRISNDVIGVIRNAVTIASNRYNTAGSIQNLNALKNTLEMLEAKNFEYRHNSEARTLGDVRAVEDTSEA